MPLFLNKSKKELKNSFFKVKEDINGLKKELKDQNDLIFLIIKRLEALEMEMKLISPTFLKNSNNLTPFFNVPQEIKGSKHSLTHSLSTHSLNNNQEIKDFKMELEKKFSTLQKRKLLAFLIVYELEEELDFVTYTDLASKMGITAECVRTYISSLIGEGIPIVKKRINNKITCLSILPDFRALGLKNKLENLYYNKDPKQKRLFDKF